MAATFGTGGGNFSGQAAARPAAMRDLLPMTASGPWWFMHHPARWLLVGDEWLPALGKLTAEPGINRVDKDGNTDLAEVAKRKQGWTIIPWEIEAGGYCIAWDGTNGKVHLSKWETPQMMAGQVRVRSDESGYWDFCRRLVNEGHVSLPDPAFIDVIIERQAGHVETLRSSAPTHPASALVLPHEEAKLATMQAAKDKLFSAEPVAPKRGRK